MLSRYRDLILGLELTKREEERDNKSLRGNYTRLYEIYFATDREIYRERFKERILNFILCESNWTKEGNFIGFREDAEKMKINNWSMSYLKKSI